MNLRHEWKHEISPADLAVLRQRLRAAARPDGHGRDGVYQIRSLYFDTPEDRVLREKLDGLDRREKFRIRCYDGNYSCIRLEKKSKINGLCGKESAPLTAGEVRGLLAGERAWMTGSGRNLVWELYSKMTAQRLGPKTIVDYTHSSSPPATCGSHWTTASAPDWAARTFWTPAVSPSPSGTRPSSWRSSGTPSSRTSSGRPCSWETDAPPPSQNTRPAGGTGEAAILFL